ncbi:MAG: hypothetical protein D6790_03440 [Caldilineae bacterium]|nr:MAG: hypothetical protein D6790_03440 [Caldilineae bacterium]
MRGIRLWRKNKSFVYNLHPPQIPADSARFSYTLGLGGLAVLFTAITILSGLLLMFYYVPTAAQAHASLIYIDSVVFFGRFIRSLHYWAAQGMVVAAILHMGRIVFTGGYRPPRDLNWQIGLGLLTITLLWSFSGYVLRWDEHSIWALLVGTNLLKVVPGVGDALYLFVVGDVTLGDAGLLRFYAWHVFGLALLGGGSIAYHIWRIRVDGGISRAPLPPGERRRFISREALFFQEFIAALLATGALFLLAAFAPPGLAGPADLAAVDMQEAKAPWFFLAIQELLRYTSPLWAGWIIPLAGLLLLAALPLVDRRGPGRGRWFAGARWKPQTLFAVFMLSVIILGMIAALR